MPRLEARDTRGQSSGGGGIFSGKVLGTVLLIACSAAYGVYQYEQYFPKKSRPAARGAAAQKNTKQNPMAGLSADLEKFGLTEDQRRRLAAIDKQSTDTRSKVRQAVRVLTPEQRKQFQKIRAEARKEARARAEKRRAKYFPNPQDAAYAQAAVKAIREQRAARQKAAQAGKPSTHQ